MFIFTCKDCHDRKSGCHDTCEKYLREKVEYERIKGMAKEEDEINYYESNQMFKKRNKALRKYGKAHV